MRATHRRQARDAGARTTITRSEYRAIMRLHAIVDVATRELAHRLERLGLDPSERVGRRGPVHWPSKLEDLAYDAGIADVTNERENEAFAREVIALTDDIK